MTHADTTRDRRKPVFAIMGEFSAGKSTLSNLLIGSSPLPVKVTATQLPPVWISFGDAPAWREDLDGARHPVDLDRLAEVPLDETAYIRVYFRSDILQMCDLIDMPGISDPNMSSDVWERVIDRADGVIWCCHATQAWRQSEAAVWKPLAARMADKSLLMITRFDKIHGAADRERVLRRVERETAGLFRGIFPISLLHAAEAGENRQKWIDSGAEAFARGFVDLVAEVEAGLTQQPRLAPLAASLAAARDGDAAGAPDAPATADTPAAADAPGEGAATAAEGGTGAQILRFADEPEEQPPAVRPTRVRLKSDRPARPQRPESDQDTPAWVEVMGSGALQRTGEAVSPNTG